MNPEGTISPTTTTTIPSHLLRFDYNRQQEVSSE
jgi:hypothetical protein